MNEISLIKTVSSSDNEVVATYNFLCCIRSSATRKAYLNDIILFKKWLTSRKYLKELFKVTDSEVALYLVYLEKIQLSSTTINRKLSALSSFYQFLYRKRLINENPVNRIKRPRYKINNPTEEFTDEEVRKLFDCITRTKNSNKELYLLVFGLFFYTGLRISEILTIETKNLLRLNKEKWLLRVEVKGKKVREVVLNDTVLSFLHSYMDKTQEYFSQNHNSQRLLVKKLKFSKDSFKYITYKEIYYLFKTLSKKIGIDYKTISPHSARATVISNLIYSGVSIERVSEYVAHSDISTTKKYYRRHNNIRDDLSSNIRY